MNPILQLGKRRQSEVKLLAQGLLLASGKAEIQTLEIRPWLLGA